MPIHLSFDELLAFTDAERAKWDVWIRAQPPAILFAPFQCHGQFSTVWKLLDHLFVVERRHVQRLRSEYPLPNSTGIVDGDWDQMWKWAVETRRELVMVAAGLNEEDGQRVRQVQLPGGWAAVSPRKLLFHVLFHEIRHWAQLALALRNAGYQPPGEHDLVFSSVLP